MATDGNQRTPPLAFGAHHAAKDAPAKVLRMIESEAQALAVSIASGHHKLDHFAAAMQGLSIGPDGSAIPRDDSGKGE